MSGHPFMRSVAVVASAALLVSALAGPALAKPDKEAKAAAKVEAKAERQSEQQARAAARAEAKAAKQAAKVEAKAAKQAAKVEAKAVKQAAKVEAKAAKQAAKVEAKAAKQAAKVEAKQATAEAKALCKDGGWEGLATAEGDSFKNQGQCVKFAVHGGVPMPPMGPWETACDAGGGTFSEETIYLSYGQVDEWWCTATGYTDAELISFSDVLAPICYAEGGVAAFINAVDDILRCQLTYPY